MFNREETIKVLHYYAIGLESGAFNHEIHAKIYGAKGFKKIEEKLNRHAAEEREFVGKFMKRILELGGTIQHDVPPVFPVIDDIKKYFEHELNMQKTGVENIGRLLKNVDFDLTSRKLMEDNYKSEEDDLYWYQEELEIIENIGLQNYLSKQV